MIREVWDKKKVVKPLRKLQEFIGSNELHGETLKEMCFVT